jgi:hypothetical protein
MPSARSARYDRWPSCPSRRRLVFVSRQAEHARVCGLLCSSNLAGSPVSIRNNPFSPLRKRRGQWQFREGDPLLGLIFPAYRDELVVFGDIDPFHNHGHAENLRLERKLKVVLHHGVEAGHLFRLAVGVHQRFLDKLIEPCLAQARFFTRYISAISLCTHTVFLYALPAVLLENAGESGGGFLLRSHTQSCCTLSTCTRTRGNFILEKLEFPPSLCFQRCPQPGTGRSSTILTWRGPASSCFNGGKIIVYGTSQRFRELDATFRRSRGLRLVCRSSRTMRPCLSRTSVYSARFALITAVPQIVDEEHVHSWQGEESFSCPLLDQAREGPWTKR